MSYDHDGLFCDECEAELTGRNDYAVVQINIERTETRPEDGYMINHGKRETRIYCTAKCFPVKLAGISGLGLV